MYHQGLILTILNKLNFNINFTFLYIYLNINVLLTYFMLFLFSKLIDSSQPIALFTFVAAFTGSRYFSLIFWNNQNSYQSDLYFISESVLWYNDQK